MIRLQNVLKMSSRRICETSWRRFEDVLKMSWRRLEDVLKTSWKRLEDVLKTYGQDEYIGLDQDVLKTSSEDVWLIKIYSSSSRCLEDALKTFFEVDDEKRLHDVFKTSSRRLHQDECLLDSDYCPLHRRMNISNFLNFIVDWSEGACFIRCCR